MASPIGHTIAGYIGYQLLTALPVQAKGRWQLWGAIALANLPDLDFIPGLLVGSFREFHRHGTHSLFFTVVVGLSVALGGWLHGRRTSHLSASVPIAPRYLLWGIWATVLCAGHLGLDLTVIDRLPPSGLQVWWPFSASFFTSPVTFLPGLIFDPILSWQNVKAVSTEILLLAPLAVLLSGLLSPSKGSELPEHQ